jgi:hypothetical protein
MSGLKPIDILAPGYFWLLQPWKEGRLATIDGWGRFAEISFIGSRAIMIRPLVNFPRMQMDRRLLTWPEAGLIASRTSDRLHHLAAIDDKKTKSHVPLLTWRHVIGQPVLFDSSEGLISYDYSLRNSIEKKLFVYNYKEDRMIYESPDDFNISIGMTVNDKYNICQHVEYVGSNRRIEYKCILYNWRTEEIIENDLTTVLNINEVTPLFYPYLNIHIGKRYLIGRNFTLRQRVKVTWDEEYSDVKVTPLSYLLPEGKWLTQMIISSDGSWGSTFIGGYRGLRNEFLYKRAFFHLDDRYPNGISMPVITSDYEDYQWDYSAFVNHPVHGMCFAQEWRKGLLRFLRLYKMDDVLSEINRKLLEAAKGIMGETSP